MVRPVCLFAIFAGLATIVALPYFETRPAWWEVATLHGVDAPLGLENQLRSRIRPIFPNSVVAGGVYSTAELRGAAQADSVVATHYEGLRLDRFQPVRLASARMAHVSFRVGSQIYWTKKRITIQPGEVVLTDGTNKIRGRCGNRIADFPQLPVLPEEPTENDMDKPTPDVIVLPVPASPEDDPQAQPGALPSAVERVTNSMPPVEEDTAWWWPVVVIPPVIGGTTFPGGDVPMPLTTTPTTPPTTPAERPLTPPPPETPPAEPPPPITPPQETSPPVTPPPVTPPADLPSPPVRRRQQSRRQQSRRRQGRHRRRSRRHPQLRHLRSYRRWERHQIRSQIRPLPRWPRHRRMCRRYWCSHRRTIPH